jgi:hypothetical protein
VKSIARQQEDGNRQKAQNFARGQRVFAKHLQHIGKQRHAGSKKHQPNHIERIGMFFAVVRQMQVDHAQTREANRNIKEEYEAPMKVADDEATGDRSEHRTNQSGNSDEAHGANQFGLGEGSHYGEPADRHHHGSTATLQDAARDQHMNVARNAAEK